MKPKFRPRFPWIGGDLQTLRNRFVERNVTIPGPSEEFRAETPDGDTLTGTLHPAPEGGQPLVVLFHGLTGSEDSTYMLVSARHHLSEGRGVLRMNLRGAGSSEALCAKPYSGASWPDMMTVLEALDPAWMQSGVILVGYSMGGNILLNALPHLPTDAPVIGAATVSAPIDPTAASRQLMQPRNRIYQASLLKEMKRFWLARPEAGDANVREAIETAASIWDFDDRVTGPHIGYAGAAEYYDATAGIKKIVDVRVPLLLIHAANDPWIPARSYFSLPLQDNLRVEIAASGGHVGFHGADPQPWHDLRIAAFIAGLNRREADRDLP